MPRPQKVEITMAGKTLADCDALMQRLEAKTSLKRLWHLRGSELDKQYLFFEKEPNVHDFSEIRRKIRSCSLANGDEVHAELIKFLKAVEKAFRGLDIGKAAERYQKIIDDAFDSVGFVETGFGRLQGQLEKLIEVDVPDVGHPIGLFDEKQAQELAERLNKLNSRQKLKVEWIIRQHWPALPAYAEGIDLLELPATVVDSILEVIDSHEKGDGEALLLTS